MTIEFFYTDKRNKNMLRGRCRPCEKECERRAVDLDPERKERRNKIGRDWAKANPDRHRENGRKWQENHPDKTKVYNRSWRVNHPDRAKAKDRRRWQNNPDKERARERLYALNNPDKMRMKNHNRRARVRGLAATFTTEQEVAARRYFEGRCAICGRLPDFWHIIAMDHWIAIFDLRPDNPGTVASNMLPMCHSVKGVPVNDIGCNNSKHDHDPIKWINSHFGKKQAKIILARIEAYFVHIAEQHIDK